MLKASALYIVIVIALVIAVICSSLIVSAYFYRLEYQMKFRQDELTNNVGSAVNILLADDKGSFSEEKRISLFENSEDSVTAQQLPWGIFDIGIAKAFKQKDTLYRVFSTGNTIDSGKWAALYIIDEDRPISVSGKTVIRGDAYIPKAGIKQAYVDNKAYEGDMSLVQGKKRDSEKALPGLNVERLSQLEKLMNQNGRTTVSLQADSINNSFMASTRIFSFGKKIQKLENISLSGNIILLSDTLIEIDQTAQLNNILVFAKSISVKSGFHGNCQLFATDSIGVGEHCSFNYPSSIGVLRFSSNNSSPIAKINIRDHSTINGIVFNYIKDQTELKPIIKLGKNTIVKGQIYSSGMLELQDGVEIDGSVFTNRFIYRGAYTLYENYLINATIDSKRLSKYYLTGALLPVADKHHKRVLQWLEVK